MGPVHTARPAQDPVAICLALLMLALNSKDFSQALQLVGQY
jgi:hypothetical protein